ncbi:glucose-6-phosphate isomerase [Xanthomonadaceae bacterium XH05]|nr:glucose-6-phosphate isomerase [Xanthomonadaceae bacterium XH05]
MHTPAWLERLTPHAVRMVDQSLRDLFVSDPDRIGASTLQVGPVHACFARQRIDAAAQAALLDLARERDIKAAFTALHDGAPVNRSEQRPALHVALRSSLGRTAVAKAAHAQARETFHAMGRLVDALRASDVTDLINIGIGGSDLGPRLALDALRDVDAGRFRVHFLSTADGHAVSRLLGELDPAKTAAILVSKSFGTQETLLNGQAVRDWLGADERLYAVTANTDRAAAFGIVPGRTLPMWDWVGGRYSLWSAVGFVVAAALGLDVFERLLAGAAAMDEHVLHATVESNLAIRHALVAVWNRNAMGHDTHAVLPYDERLARLPAYLQQLVMESLGKSVTQDGRPVGCGTSPVIWGGAGTDVQHSFFQALHQGTDVVPMDFIGTVRVEGGYQDLHRAQMSNLLAQSEAFANGTPSDDPQKAYAGNRPSSVILLDDLSPESLGALLAMYEHSVYAQATIWGINPFDQWGVELGKTLASGLMEALVDPMKAVGDPVTRLLIERIRAGG